MTPACKTCGVLMECSKTGAIVEIADGDGEPYQVWSGDVFQCPSCHVEVVAQYGAKPIAERFTPGFEGWRDRASVHIV